MDKRLNHYFRTVRAEEVFMPSRSLSPELERSHEGFETALRTSSARTVRSQIMFFYTKLVK